MMNISDEKSLIRAREKLIAAGYLDYQRGRKGTPGSYRLRDLYWEIPSTNASINASRNASQNVRNVPVETPDINRPKTKNETKEKSPTETKRNDAFADYAGEDTNLLSALEDYGAMRRKIKRPMTERAKKQLCNRLDKLAGTAAGKVELLNEAILHCWRSVYVPDGWKEGARGNADNAGADPGKAAKGYRLRSALDDLDGY